MLVNENAWLWDGTFHFLDKKESLHHDHRNHVGFTSFARSGNAFLRRYIEQITGVVTGSTLTLHMATAVQIMSMKGEYVADDSVWIARGHHPLINPASLSFKANKTFCCVRNPLDVFQSYADFNNTLSHGTKPNFEISEHYPEWWNWFVKRQATVMKRYFEILKRNCHEEGQNPLYIVRYEDLVLNPKETLMGLFGFLLGVKDLTGTNTERRIDKVLSMGRKATTVY